MNEDANPGTRTGASQSQGHGHQGHGRQEHGSGPRILLVGRRFWPHGSLDKAAHLIELASGLKRRGAEVEILTPRYAAGWAKECVFREIPVHRPVLAPRSDWTTGRYLRHLSKWIQERGNRYDLVFVDAAREESIAVIEASRSTRRPVVVRLSTDQQQHDLHWWDSSRLAQRCANAARAADAIVVSGSSRQRELVSRGITAQRIVCIDTGFETSIAADEAQRIMARRALAAINRDLHAPADEPIAMCISPMEPATKKVEQRKRHDGAHVMVQSARHIVARYPLLHLWFVGDGSRRDLIYDTLRSDGIRASIAMPGSFGNTRDLFDAANVFVQLDEQGLDHFLPTAVAARLPVVAADLPEIREVLRASQTARLSMVTAAQDPENNANLVAWFDPNTPKTFRQAMRRVMDDLPLANSNAQQLHRNLIRVRSQADVVDDYLRLFDQVIAKRKSSDQGPSMGAVS